MQSQEMTLENSKKRNTSIRQCKKDDGIRLLIRILHDSLME